METAETFGLRAQIERALQRGAGSFDPGDVLPRLARLARLSPAASDDGVFAHQKLAELLVDRDPWRAALYARRAIAHRPDDDRSWATLAFCQTLLRNFRCATTAYKKAIACAPANPWYAHNLGHIYDVALGESVRALPYLKAAYAAKSESSEIVASYAHALARAGKLDEARTVVDRARARAASGELDAVLRWIDQGAPSRPRKRGDAPKRPVTPRRLTRMLAQGLDSLPFDANQRGRALALARDAGPSPNIAAVAAAVAYAIVALDHIPLTQGEVAATFRVGVGELRGVYAELRAKLDIVRTPKTRRTVELNS